MIFDSHTHAWRLWPYDGAVPDQTTRGSSDHLIYEMDRHGVERALVVAACIDENPDNNDYVAQSVGRYPDRLLHLADVDSFWSRTHHTPGAAARLESAAAMWKMRGFTHYVDGANDRWFVSGDGTEFFRTASELGLVASLAINPSWWDDTIRVAEENPRLPIFLHHLALVPAETQRGPDLRQRLAELAACQNIYIKASGFAYVVSQGFNYPHPDCRWLFDALYSAFGPSRLLWGSDFPAVSRFMTYTQSLELVRTHMGLGQSDLEMILGGNLARVFDSMEME